MPSAFLRSSTKDDEKASETENEPSQQEDLAESDEDSDLGGSAHLGGDVHNGDSDDQEDDQRNQGSHETDNDQDGVAIDSQLDEYVAKLLQTATSLAISSAAVKQQWKNLVWTFSFKYPPWEFPSWALNRLGEDTVLTCLRAEFGEAAMQKTWSHAYGAQQLVGRIKSFLNINYPETAALWFGADERRCPTKDTFRALIKAYGIKKNDKDEPGGQTNPRVQAAGIMFRSHDYKLVMEAFASRTGYDMQTRKDRARCVFARTPFSGTFVTKNHRLSPKDFQDKITPVDDGPTAGSSRNSVPADTAGNGTATSDRPANQTRGGATIVGSATDGDDIVEQKKPIGMVTAASSVSGSSKYAAKTGKVVRTKRVSQASSKDPVAKNNGTVAVKGQKNRDLGVLEELRDTERIDIGWWDDSSDNGRKKPDVFDEPDCLGDIRADTQKARSPAAAPRSNSSDSPHPFLSSAIPSPTKVSPGTPGVKTPEPSIFDKSAWTSVSTQATQDSVLGFMSRPVTPVASVVPQKRRSSPSPSPITQAVKKQKVPVGNAATMQRVDPDKPMSDLAKALSCTSTGVTPIERDFKSVKDPKGWLTDNAIDIFLTWFASVRPSCTTVSVHNLDPSREPNPGVGRLLVLDPSGTLVDNALLCVNPTGNHWIAAWVDVAGMSATVFDSLVGDEHNRRRTLGTVEKVLKPVFDAVRPAGSPSVSTIIDVVSADCAQQDGGYDCGIFALVNCCRKVVDLEPLETVAATMWRLTLYSMMTSTNLAENLPAEARTALETHDGLTVKLPAYEHETSNVARLEILAAYVKQQAAAQARVIDERVYRVRALTASIRDQIAPTLAALSAAAARFTEQSQTVQVLTSAVSEWEDMVQRSQNMPFADPAVTESATQVLSRCRLHLRHSISKREAAEELKRRIDAVDVEGVLLKLEEVMAGYASLRKRLCEL